MAPARVEQLHYTWTPRGVEGVNRFQIAAMSPGFKAGALAPLLPAVRKLCRYDRPKGKIERLPVSFGWLDHRRHRIAFHRVGLPPQRGKRGNFAAHLLVGPLEAMPAAALAATFGSPFWWSGAGPEELEEIAAGKREFDLPPVDLEEAVDLAHAPASAAGGEPAALQLLRALARLPSDRRLAVLGDSEAFGRALAQVARGVPEAVEELSLSTYEGAPTFPFRVIGTQSPGPRLHKCQLEQSWDPEDVAGLTAERLLSPGRRQVLLHGVSRTAGSGAAEPRIAMFETATSVVGLATGTSVVSEEVAAVLADPDALAYIGAEASGRAGVAEAIHRGMSATLRSLAPALERMEVEEREALYGAIAERCAEGELSGIAAVADAIPAGPGREALLGAVLQAAVADESAAGGLEAEDAALLLGEAARRGISEPAISALLLATCEHLSRCAREPTVPDVYLARMFRSALADPANSHAIAEALKARPAIVAAGTLGDEEKGRCMELLEEMPSGQLEGALPALLPAISESEPAERIQHLLAPLPLLAAARCLTSAADAFAAGALPASLSGLCDTNAVSLLDEGEVRPALGLLARSRSPDHPLAAQLLQCAIGEASEPAISVIARSGELESQALRAGLDALALETAVGLIREPRDAAEAWSALRAVHRDASEAESLQGLLEIAVRQPQSHGNAALLAWVCRSLLPASPKLLSRAGHLRDRGAEELAKAVALQVPQWQWEQFEPYVALGDPRSASWWGRLDSERARYAKAQERRARRSR